MNGSLFDSSGSVKVGTYPASPGFKVSGTSQEAARSVNNAAALREAVMAMHRRNPVGLTDDEVADLLEETVLNIRPRCSELRSKKQPGGPKLLDTGLRRKNTSGKRAMVCRLAKLQKTT